MTEITDEMLRDLRFMCFNSVGTVQFNVEKIGEIVDAFIQAREQIAALTKQLAEAERKIAQALMFSAGLETNFVEGSHMLSLWQEMDRLLGYEATGGTE
jgi:hypothetical protein